MPVTNAEIAETFREIADLLAIEGANRFRVRAYRDAAGTVARLSHSIAHLVEEGDDLSELQGIGDDLARKIVTMVEEDGHLAQLDEIRARTPPGLVALLDVDGLGPKRVRRLHDELGIETLDDLAKAARQERLRTVRGFGPKLEQKILKSVQEQSDGQTRTLLRDAEQSARPLLAYMEACGAVTRIALAGSYRRRKQTVGDLDLVASSDEPAAVTEHLAAYADVDQVVSQGDTRATVILRTGLQVDLRAVAPRSFGAALLYLTGSRAHTLELRNRAMEQDQTLNEYGLFPSKDVGDTEDTGADDGPIDAAPLAGETEEEIYAAFDLETIPPELREDRGEFQAAHEHRLPMLVTQADLRGDLQCHTSASDGNDELRAMAEAAQELGYAYLAVTDHSQHVGVTQGLDADEVAAQMETIDELNQEFDGFRLLKAVEVDVLEDGSLALPDHILSRLDLCVFAVHTHFDLARDEQTERIIRAMDNPHVHILAHPTGRRIGTRPGYAVDLTRVMEAALERGCYLEINAQPDRLDLDDVHAKMAKEMGLKVAISTDAHAADGLRAMRFGVDQARRGWLEADDVLNSRKWAALRKLLAR